MQRRLVTKRRLVLVILAIVIPILALIGLGTGLILQESQLEESRRIEAYERHFDSFVATLDRLTHEHREVVAKHISTHGWSSLESLVNASHVVLVGKIDDDELVLPWQLDERVNRFYSLIYSGPYGRSLERAERLEFRSGSLDQAVESYRRILSTTRDSLKRAFARLSLARSLDKAGSSDEAYEQRLALLNLPVQFTDDFGVPLALYAAHQLANDTRLTDSLSRKLMPFIGYPLYLSPQAGYLLRAVHDSLRVASAGSNNADLRTLGNYVQASLASIRLQDDFSSVLPRLRSQSGEPSASLYADGDWLLTIYSDQANTDVLLVAFDAHVLVREAEHQLQLASLGYSVSGLSSESGAPNTWLGPSFPGIYAQLADTALPDQRMNFMSRVSFIALAMVLIICLTTLGFVLWWRDMRREIVTAELRSKFVSSVSHELKTPLTSIRMYAETLRLRSPPRDVQEDYLDTIINESGRLTRLLNNVLDFSKLERGAKEYNLLPIVLQDVLSAAMETMEYPLKAQSFLLRTEIDDTDILVNADADALEQVFLNLLTNAMKFSGDQREIELGAARNGEYVEVWVRDFGIGINAENLDRIFNNYYRTESAVRSNIPGTGLGLSLVKHTVESHSGEISVESTPGAGSTFTVNLPLA